MGGSNPYVNQEPPPPATRKFTITFLPMQVTVEVDPDKIPYGHTGLPGSILDIALANGIEIDHACGGVCACSTCHCIVRQGLETIPEMTDTEEEELSFAPGLTPSSRLSCQSVPDGTSDLVVLIPNWNRNAVREGH
jgi:2Fe-2S ferredoxin